MAILEFGALIRRLGPAVIEASLGDLPEDKLAISNVMNPGSENRHEALVCFRQGCVTPSESDC